MSSITIPVPATIGTPSAWVGSNGATPVTTVQILQAGPVDVVAVYGNNSNASPPVAGDLIGIVRGNAVQAITSSSKAYYAVERMSSDPSSTNTLSVELSTIGIVGTGDTLTAPNFAGYTEVESGSSVSGAVSIDVSKQGVFDLTLTANITSLAFTGVAAAGKCVSLTLFFTQGGTGSYTVAWPGSVKWGNTGAPVLSTVVGKTDVISLMTKDGGTTWYGFTGGTGF